MSKATDTANDLLSRASELGWHVEVRGSILTITKNIKPNSEDFCIADSEYYGILDLLKATRPGSVWGTDGGGVGAMEAMRTGVFRMNKSGGDKRVLNALKKALA